MKESLTRLSDLEIVSELQQGGGPQLFSELYRRYYPKVLGKCFSFVKQRELARELTEDIFSKAYEKLSAFRRQASFSSWLYAIAYNHCIDYLRERKKLHYPNWNNEQELGEIVDETEEDLSEINYERLMEIMEQIHPEEKAMLLMKYQDDVSIRDISEVMRITENATKMRLKRARARVFYLYKKKYLEA